MSSVAEKRPLGALGRMGMVAGIHVAALYLIASSLGIVPPLAAPPPPLEVFNPEVAPPDDPLPVVQPSRVEIPTLTMPIPVVSNDAFESTETISVERTDTPPVVREFVPVEPDPVLVGVRPDARHPLTQPAYPAIDVRQGNEGSVELEIYVLPNGRVGDVRVIKSAGSPTLDQSAIDEAKRRWRLLPATRDGEPFAQWHRLRVVFNLKDR
jgi:protein TonB